MNAAIRKFVTQYVKNTPKEAGEYALFAGSASTLFWLLEDDIPKLQKDFSSLKTHEKALTVVGLSGATAVISTLRILSIPYLGYFIYNKTTKK